MIFGEQKVCSYELDDWLLTEKSLRWHFSVPCHMQRSRLPLSCCLTLPQGASETKERVCMQVARAAWRLVTKHVYVCASCGLLGCWSHCQGCKTASYCSDKCQK